MAAAGVKAAAAAGAVAVVVVVVIVKEGDLTEEDACDKFS